MKVLHRRATGFDNQAKKWKGPCSPREDRDMLPQKILKFYSCKRCVFLHSEAADTVFQLPKKDNFSGQFNHDLVPISTTQISS